LLKKQKINKWGVFRASAESGIGYYSKPKVFFSPLIQIVELIIIILTIGHCFWIIP